MEPLAQTVVESESEDEEEDAGDEDGSDEGGARVQRSGAQRRRSSAALPSQAQQTVQAVLQGGQLLNRLFQEVRTKGCFAQ
jgi:hypothetical protein